MTEEDRQYDRQYAIYKEQQAEEYEAEQEHLASEDAKAIADLEAEEAMEQDKGLLTPEEEGQVEKELRQSYLKALKAFQSSQGFAPEPHLPTLKEIVRAKLKAQLVKDNQKIEELFKEIEDYFRDLKGTGSPILITDFLKTKLWWQSLKDKYGGGVK